MPEAADRKTTRTTRKKKPAARKKTTKKRAPRAKQTGQGTVRVKQVRSGIGHAATYRRTLEALGLRHHQQVVTVPDNPSTRGALDKVRHLVEVLPPEEA